MHTVHIGYYHEMMRDIPEQIDALDALISQHLDREINKLDTVEHAILLVGAYELQNRLEIPYKVVLDEAMKLNNHFGATDAHKLINAVLDRMAVELRAPEVEADSKANLRTSQKAAAKPAIKPADVDTTTITEKPTVLNKPRISANNTSVKRNSASKALANITDYKASKQNDTQNTVEESIIKPASNDSNDKVTAEVELLDSNNVDVDIKGVDVKKADSESVESNHADEKSQD
jgi:N utilization substance protein B